MAQGRNFYDDQLVFIGDPNALPLNELHGVQSFDGNWSIPRTPLMAAGYDFVGTVIEGELQGEVSVSRLIVSSGDPITGLLGTSLSGYLVYGTGQSFNKSFNFSQGYVTSYESSCSIGEVATCDFSLTAYGSAGKNSAIPSNTYTEITPSIATANSIVLTTPFGTTNCVQSYSFSLDLSRSPTYRMGDKFKPSAFETQLPIVGSLDFEVTVDDYEVKEIMDAVCSSDFVDNLSIALNQKCSGSLIRNFTLNNAELVNSSISAGIGNNLTVNLGYTANYNSINALTGIFG